MPSQEAVSAPQTVPTKKRRLTGGDGGEHDHDQDERQRGHAAAKDEEDQRRPDQKEGQYLHGTYRDHLALPCPNRRFRTIS
jgi:hypothetical protein